MRLTVKGALLLTMAPARPEPFQGWLTVDDDGRIAGIGPGDPPPTTGEVVDVGGSFVAPGFVSAHSHIWTTGSRGMATDLSLYGWIEAMTRYTRQAAADDVYWLTLHGALDYLNNGVTTVYDFADSRLAFTAASAGVGRWGGTFKPAAWAEAQIRAKVDAGIRFVHSVWLDDSVGSEDDALERLAETVAYAEGYRGHAAYLGMALSGAAQWSTTESTAALEVEAMRRHGLLNQPHLLETPHALEDQWERFRWYERAGAFGPSLVFGHFVHARPEQIVQAADAGCGMVWQPASNGRLASGVADIPACRAAGMRVGVGLDDLSCSDQSDPFANMRIGIYLLRATRRDPMVMPVRDMLELHTLGSARVLGIDAGVGSLEVGKFADFLVVDPLSPDTGPVWDPYGTYVLACGLRNLRRVYVGGRLMSLEGRICRTDGGEASRQIHERLGRLRRQVDHDGVGISL
jgi:5-methylthioadenosine/S-adenosylhomocysteine deaminase